MGTLLGIVIVVAVLLLLRRFVCWFLKIDRVLEQLADIRRRLDNAEEDTSDAWVVRVAGKLRPMQVKEYRLSGEELVDWAESGEVDLTRAHVCAPGGTEFVRFETVEGLRKEVAALTADGVQER